MALPRLLAQAGAGPERERDGVVLVEHLVDRLGEEDDGSVGSSPIGCVTETTRMPSRSRSSCLVAARLDLVSREARGVVDEHDVEAPLGRVGHQPLKLGPAVGLLPAEWKSEYSSTSSRLVLDGEAPDRLSLSVGREALALLLGRLAHIGDGARLTSAQTPLLLLPRSLRPAASAEPPVDEPAREGDDFGVEFLGLLMGVLLPFPTGRSAILDESRIGRRPQPRRHSAPPPDGCTAWDHSDSFRGAACGGVSSRLTRRGAAVTSEAREAAQRAA